ncbi:type II toxin-antitoxin system VapC family toxin [Salmonella enterica]|nr:type II toxin-antitoxin system VapC family toxin [Salmonella enterica]
MSVEAILVTNNTREFERVLEDWVNLLQTNVSFGPGS